LCAKRLPRCERSLLLEAIESCGRSVQRTYTVEQVAEILDISVRYAYDLCEKAHDFKVIRLGKRCIRIHKESFDKWFDELNDSS